MKNIGRYKTWLNRLQSYLGPLNFLMIMYLYIVQEPLGLTWQIWVIILGSFLTVLLIVDLLIIFPSEQQYISRKNPEWRELRDDVHQIKKQLEEHHL